MRPDDRLAEDVAGLNSWVIPDVGRSWQGTMLRTGMLRLGGVDHPYGTMPIDHDRYELRPLGPDLPRLITDDAGAGWGVIGVVHDGAVWGLPAPGQSSTVLERPTDLLAAAEPGNRGIDPAGSPRNVRVGHSNFAHFLWNNLPALVLWEEEAADLATRGEVVSDLHPGALGQLRCLGTEAELLPRLAPFIGPEGGWPPPNTLRLGSTIVSGVARQRVVESLRRVPVAEAAHPRLWIGVRHPNVGRTPDNTADLCVELASLWPALTGGDVVVDGYTVDGLTGGTPVDRARQAESLPLVDQIVAQAQLRLRESGPIGREAAARVLSTRDLTLRESVALAGTADYYVSGVGTTQHKIGWVWNTPGLVLTPPDPARDSRARWPGLMVEGGLLPDQLPRGLVEWTHEPDRYRVTDPREAARWCVARGLEVLGPDSPAQPG